MKKIILLIIAVLSLTTFTVDAFAINKVSNDNHTQLIADSTGFKPTLIPKPDLLPGPDPTRQTEEGGTRSILVDTILPFFAIGLIGFVGGLSLVFLIIAGVRFATAYGNEEAVQKAKDQAMYALVGLVIALLSYTIVTIVINLRFVEKTSTQNTQSTTQEESITLPAELEPEFKPEESMAA